MTTEDYLAAVLRLGKMAYTREPVDRMSECFEKLCEDEEKTDVFPAFAVLRAAFSLDAPEAVCVALWMYHDAFPVPPLTAAELLECCRRLGGRPPRPVLSRLFLANREQAVLHPVIADFLTGGALRLPGGASLILPEDTAGFPHARELYDDLVRLLATYIERTDITRLLIALCGEAGCGRKFFFARLAAGMNCPLLRVDLSKNPDIGDILLAAELYGAIVCVEKAGDARQIAEIISRAGLAFAVCAGDEFPPEDESYTVLRRDMPDISQETRDQVFAGLTQDVPFAADVNPYREMGSRRLNAGHIKALADKLKIEVFATGKPIDRQTFSKIAHELGGVRITGGARLESAGTLADLALPPDQMKQLGELCSFVGKRDTIYKKWGFGEKIKWGRGISTLFYGAPGTGKTMAAAILANETGLTLMRVDLSQLISKYIGETQKSIGRVFDQAAKSDCILFFDEADALFSKRSESSDAQDKYANAETAYLLQRMEQHDGICILATNFLQNFDDAFRRRISYMLHFPMPDETLREKIWHGVFPEKAPVGSLDYAFLAKHLELSGASIKNCAIHAAYLAAVNDTSITMRDILDGAKNEYAKMGKSLSPQVTQLFFPVGG